MGVLSGKKVAIIVAFRDFRDEEYFIPKQILEENGAQIITASSSLGQAIGWMGGDTKVQVLVSELKTEKYDAILFIGGQGAAKYVDDADFHRVARETVEKNKVLGAICIASTILAKAGVLSGKKATVWSSPLDKSAIKILKAGGASFQPGPVVVDGKIVTASGPEAAKDFAAAIINLLK